MSEGAALYLRRLWEAWSRSPVELAVCLGFFLLLVGLTLLRRGRSGWTLGATLGALSSLALLHLNYLVLPLLGLVVDALQATHDALGLPRVPGALWEALPAWAVALVGLVAFDCANYWNHRLLHTRALWPVHAVHHSDTDLTGLSAFRVHALERLVMLCSYVVLLGWLNLPPGALGILVLVRVLHTMYVHADLDWTHGPLELLIASPRFHRWHHADVAAAHGKNLASLMPLFDRLFGTWYCPGPCRAPVGAAGVPAHDPFKLCLWPLVAWSRELRAAAGYLGRRLTAPRGAVLPAAHHVLAPAVLDQRLLGLAAGADDPGRVAVDQ